MKIFISWSGDRSKQVALLLKDWLQSVIQAVKPWVSADDIERGSIWFNDINNALGDVKIGIVVLTEENKTKPWILFESGALAKGLTTNRVCTFLVDLKPSDILQNPLSQFNHTESTKEGLFKLIETINNNQENKLNEKVLTVSFETFYPQFEKLWSEIISSTKKTINKKEEIQQPELIEEVLQVVRNIERRMIDNEIMEPTIHHEDIANFFINRKKRVDERSKRRSDLSIDLEDLIEFKQTRRDDDNHTP